MIKNKKNENKKLTFPSELRLDPVNKDWVIIATGRAKRPEMFKKERKEKIKISKKECPFCNIETQEKPVLIFASGKKFETFNEIPKNWTTAVIPNKYPALLPGEKIEKEKEDNFYQKMKGLGFCELVLTRDHNKSLAQISLKNFKEVLDAYQLRYLKLMKEKFVNYISIFHNEGRESGATQPHCHSQIITTPLIDSDLKKALFNSEVYFKNKRKCIYCQMNIIDKKNKKRVIFENQDFLVLCPFASKSAFEIIISPKKHSPYFEKITEKEKWQLAKAFQISLKKLYKGLNNPSYNFYLHTAPCDGKEYPFYHWHFTIFPKTSVWAGFELGARMEISAIEPEKAADYLRKQKI